MSFSGDTNTTSSETTSSFFQNDTETTDTHTKTTSTSTTGSTTTDISSSSSQSPRPSSTSSSWSTSSQNRSISFSESRTPRAYGPSASTSPRSEQSDSSHPSGSNAVRQNTAPGSSGQVHISPDMPTTSRSPTQHSRSRSRSILFTAHPTKLVLTDTSSSNPTIGVSGEVAVVRQVVVAGEEGLREEGLRSSREERDLKHPFAHTTSKLELIPSGSGSGSTIDVEEEARLYDELSRVYEDDTDEFTRSNTPTVLSSRSGTHAKLTKPKPKKPLLSPLLRGRTLSEFGPSSSSSSAAALVSRRSTNPSSSSTSSATATPTQSAPHPISHSHHSHSQAQAQSSNQTRRPSYQTHRRRPSSLPPSIETQSVFSADIYLADNTNGRRSNAATAASRPPAPLFAQDVWIDGWSTVGDGGGRLKGKRKDTGGGGGASTLGGIGGGIKKVVQGGGAYVVYDVVIKTREGTEMRVFKRYSEFEELRERLGRSLGPTLSRSLIPQLPPKSALAKFRPAFLEQRRKYLEVFLVGVLLRPEVGGREEVREWVLE